MTIDRYDPLEPPDPEQWLALDEGVLIQLAEDYHVRAKVKLPVVRVHAVMHVVVESQVALGDATPVREKVRRLMAQGLDRHDAIHAVASVLVRHINDIMRDPAAAGDPKSRYYSALKRLNARTWRRSG